jgi:hypothetical protein
MALSLAACASGGGSSAATGGTPPAARRDATIITKQDLLDPSVTGLNVYDAIRMLRPNFLATRGTQTIVNDDNRNVVDTEAGMVHASIDDSGVLALENLKRLQAAAVLEIRLLSPAAAMQKFGATARQGPVIVVRTM